MKWLKINTVFLLSAIFSFWTPMSQADTQFRVIVDASGSMIISDPDRLTAEALRLISNLAPEEEATLGVWLFGEAPRVLLPEAPVNKVTKAKLASYMDGYLTEDVKTDLEAIMKLLLETPDTGGLSQDFNRHWILVTDGMVDISLDDEENKASRDRILNGLTQQLEAKGIHLHTVSMTGYTDKALLESLSLRTNATHTEVAVPEDLLVTFDRIFTQASPSDELPFNGNRFTVDDAIDELTLVVFHDNGIQPHIMKPNGRVLSLIDDERTVVSASDHYTLLTVTDPAPGEWEVNNVDLERSSIRIITNLSAKATAISPVMFVNEEIHSTVGLFEKNVLIDDDKMLDLLTIKQTLMRLNGETKEVISSYEMLKIGDQFKHHLDTLMEQGNYELVSLIDGQTFSRQLSQYFTVHPAIEFSGDSTRDDSIVFNAKPVNLKLNVLRSTMELELTDPNGKVTLQEMPVIGQGYWQENLSVKPNEELQIRGKLTAVTQAGARFDYWTPYWVVNREESGAATVALADAATLSFIRTPDVSSNLNVMPVLVPPSISIVQEDSSGQITVVEEEPVDDSPTANEPEETLEIPASEWVMYGVLNLIGVLFLVAGFFLFRLSKKNKRMKDEEMSDV